MNDIEHNFVDTISAERYLKWKAMVQELICVDFDMGFLLEHLHEIARVFFRRKVQLAVDAIDTRIESLKKETTDLEARHECLLSGVIALDCFQDKPLITGLWLFIMYNFTFITL